MIRKRFQGMAENIGEKEEDSRVSQVSNMAGSSNGAESGFEETQGRDEKSYVRTRRRPHRKLRLLEDDEDDDVGVFGEGFCFQEGRSEMEEGKGNLVSPTKGADDGREIDAVPVAKVEHHDASVGVDVGGRCAEFGISDEKNEADMGSWDADFRVSSKADAEDGCSGFGVLSNNLEDDVAPELGVLRCSNDDRSTECEMSSENANKADVDDNEDNAIAERRTSGKENKCDVNALLLVEKNEADLDDALLLEKNEDLGERMAFQINEKVDEKFPRRKTTSPVMEGDNGIVEFRLSREKSEADVEERSDKILDLQLPKKINVVDADGIYDGSAELEILRNKKKVAVDDGTDGCRILRKRKRVGRDDVTGREHGNAKLLLERKRRRRVADNDQNKGKEDNVLQKKLVEDGKIDRKSSIVEVKKSLNRKLGGASIIEASEVDHHVQKSSGNLEEAASGKKSEKKLRESRIERLSMGAKKFDHGISNGAGMESLIEGILLKPNSGGTPGDGRIQRNKSGIGVVSTVMDDHETKSTKHLKQSRVGAGNAQLGSRSMDRDSLRRKKSDLKGKSIAASVSPTRDSLSVLNLQKQKKMLKSPPTLQRESKIAKERKTSVPHLTEEIKRPKSSLASEEKTPAALFSKETKAMQRIARSEDRRRLRERLRDALLAAGWKIDLRPRKGKNYDDNVYISPLGTSFWSLPKAWNALKGSLGKNNEISEEISGSLEESKEAETSKHVDRVNGGDDGASNMLMIQVIDEDLSLLQRKRRRIMEDGERKIGKGKKKKKSSHEVDSDGIMTSDVKLKKRDERANKIRKDGKRVKMQKSLCKADSEDTDLTDVKLKVIKKKFRVGGLDATTPNSKFSDKMNINDKMTHQSQVKGSGSAQNIYLTPLSGQKHIKRRLHGDSERKQSTSKALSNHNLVKSGSSQVKKNKSRRGGCGLLVRSSKKGDKREQGVSTVIKRTVISWLVDVGIVPENECVQYWNKKGTRIMLEGWVRKDGILCECCSKVISVSKFEDHAGATRHRPFENIYLWSGKSLTQCLREAWDTQDESRKCGKSIIEVDEDDQNDDTCGLCGDGGDLICCDKCPSTFHQDCLELKSIPEGDWYCLNCTCGVCGKVGHLGENATSTMADVLFCEQCEHEYHKKCLQERGSQMSCPDLENSSFCGKACQKVYDGLEHLLGTSNSLADGFSWTLLRRFDDDQHSSSSQGPSQDRIAECNAKLSVAHIVMDECFMPIVDKRTNIDMVSNVVFSCWSNFSRLNYQGFYTAVLEKDDEIISVASIRIHGARLAEMPLIGTRHHYRRQGMCRRLVNAIEKMLLSLQVEKLILPAVPDLLQTWTVAFGFNPLEVSHKNEIRHLNLMVFPGTDLLQKQICSQETPTDDPAGMCPHESRWPI
ncbi:uncharacterized protein LOC131075669 isoform X1 [Cryptomeria japonica]|uniref:uncharacterized protein LOC131075669 isoform X1 n=2 Tax=Cryptomeria japonica TaxID=3369 RepID=UPI0025AC9DD3|nr:uncharacterized protein LOC131075669 isoform X1 [Cryptomeria japonica]XP_057868499.1 uncharacterized protein LOC131075669 isoform X1 [Cryptomeria japonica]XP_057868500.1 uncharacterized protein LOC131075669 isoform X1 [Cryptomeria japonica]XP_057868501.1 uncharacterized protein LOC131075669 isoform X1 [Cryptomeria japonica]XP_059074430.1 uncharacterized protein LOC131075669 isoform X1 [Cryptomeria japonica]